MQEKNEIMSYTIDGKIESWDEALPLGNGHLGCLVYGDGDLRMTVDRIDLWDRRVAPEAKEAGFNYENLIKTAHEDWDEHWRLFDMAYGHSYPTKLTVGRLAFHDIIDGNSHFTLDMAAAEASVMTRLGEIRVFMDARNFIGVAKVPHGAEFEIQVPRYIFAPDGESAPLAPTETNIEGDFKYSLKGLGYPAVEIHTDGAFTYTYQRTKDNFSYGIVVFRKDCLDCDELYFDIWQSRDGITLDEEMKKLAGFSSVGYAELLAEHKKYWDSFYGVSAVTTGDAQFDSYYIKSKYLFASTSREGSIPMSLQGVWTADNGKLPPWKADFHGDVNLQVSYEAFMKAGHFPEGRVLCDYLWDTRDSFRRFTEQFFGFSGLLLPGIFSIDGKPLGGWPQYAYNPVCGMWLAKCFDEYYLYTGDEEFFKTRAYPFLTELADSTIKILREDGEWLALPLTSSPEFFEGEPEAYLPSQSNFELSILKNLFTIVKRYADKVGNREASAEYGRILSRLKPYEMNSDGSLRICKEQDLDRSHRHFSHMLAICPFHLFSAERDRDIILANIKKLEHYGTDEWVGFSFVCLAELAAYIGEGNRAYRYMRDFIEAYTVENGFHLNGDFRYYGHSTVYNYRPFTLEAVMEFAKALQDMMLSCDDGAIILFPAIPYNWRKNKISFERLCAHGGIKLSASYEGGNVTRLTLYIPEKMKLTFKNTFGREALSFSSAEETLNVSCPIDGKFTLEFNKGEYELLI